MRRAGAAGSATASLLGGDARAGSAVLMGNATASSLESDATASPREVGDTGNAKAGSSGSNATASLELRDAKEKEEFYVKCARARQLNRAQSVVDKATLDQSLNEQHAAMLARVEANVARQMAEKEAAELALIKAERLKPLPAWTRARARPMTS